MYPDQVAGLGHLRDRVTEGSVDALVASPKALVVVDLGKEVMEQRPEGVVAEPLVVRFGFRPRQKHRACREFLPAAVRHFGLEFGRDLPARPADPHVIQLSCLRRSKVRSQPRGQAARTLGKLPVPLFLMQRHGKAIGDDDQFHGMSYPIE